MTVRNVDKIANSISKNYTKANYEDLFDDLSFDHEVCIELMVDNTLVYSSERFKGCLKKSDNLNYYIDNFMKSDNLRQRFKVINSEYQTSTIVLGMKLDDGVYAFVNASIIPLDKTIDILKNQLIIVTIIVFILGFVIAYFISKKISSPITIISNKAKNLGSDVTFDSDINIKELKDLEDTLNNTQEKLKQTEELRRELLANVSHDLKTPLTMIKAYAEMVRDLTYKNKEKRNSNLNVIIEESDRLNLLVNDILDLSVIQTNKDFEYEEFDIDKLIRSILKRYDIYKEKGYSFIYNGESCLVKACLKRLEQVIYNLINNAINYTGDDKLIYIDLVVLDDVVRVSIKDTGKGIPKKELPYIWDKYYKTNRTYKRNNVGTGLGLSIVKNILIAHNFSYGVHTSRKGTTFYFEIKR